LLVGLIRPAAWIDHLSVSLNRYKLGAIGVESSSAPAAASKSTVNVTPILLIRRSFAL